MNRSDALQRIVDATGEMLALEGDGNGWPSFGSLVTEDPPPVSLSLYVGVIGETHRGRDSVERRFQNPGQDRPIQYSTERLPLLLGLVLGEEPETDLWVGFDANRRLGRRTRYSMFVSEDLIELGRLEGWAVGKNATGEGKR